MKPVRALLFALMASLFVACEAPLTELPDDPPATDSHPTDTTITLPGLDNAMITVAQAQAMFAETDGQAVVCTVSAYIVGTVNGTALSNACFTPPFTVESNLLLADDPDERAVELCLPVQLPNKSDVRDALNLKAHPENHHARVKVTGSLERYFRVAGIKSPNAYAILGIEEEVPVDTLYVER